MSVADDVGRRSMGSMAGRLTLGAPELLRGEATRPPPSARRTSAPASRSLEIH
jgi:hypothetical protein